MKNLLGLPAIIFSVVITFLLLGFQRIGISQPLELGVFDQMMQLRAKSKPDSRLLIVGVTEEDLKNFQETLSGETLYNLLNKLEEYEPRAIGLDIFRDLPVEPGHAKLLEYLQLSDIIIPVCKQSNVGEPEVPPPNGIDPSLVGFVDIPQDPDTVIRRNLLLQEPAPNDRFCSTPYSFSLQLALKYLEVANIQLQHISKKEFKLGNAVFKDLESNSGGYHNVDDGGFQILLNYRSGKEIAEQVSLTDVLSDKVDPNLVKNRIVLIGYTALSKKDIFSTPYSSGKSDNSGQMPGVEIHAHSVSQILSAVLKPQQPFFWFLPEWAEIVWIFGWSLAGGLIASRIQHPMRLGIVGGITIAVLIGGNFFIFTQSGWVPVVSPALGFVLGAGSILGYTAHQIKQKQEAMTQRVEEQQEAIVQLQDILHQGVSNTMPTTQIIYPISVGQKIPLNTVLSNRYKITDYLAGGGFGRTYLALDTQRPGSPQCVVKQLKPARQDTGFLEVARRLFNTEAEILEILGKHQQIPQLLAYFEEERQFYLVQEFIKGYSLDQEISPGKHLSEAEVIKLLKDTLQILVFVHSYGVIHRDIKPSNLIRREDGRIFLIDFGAVKLLQPQQENKTIAIATPGYAPMEQIAGQPKINCDIYALGMVAIQALTDVEPTEFLRNRDTGKLILPDSTNTNSRDWRELAPLSNELAAILDKMVIVNFTKRYQSATEVLKSLESL